MGYKIYRENVCYPEDVMIFLKNLSSPQEKINNFLKYITGVLEPRIIPEDSLIEIYFPLGDIGTEKPFEDLYLQISIGGDEIETFGPCKNNSGNGLHGIQVEDSIENFLKEAKKVLKMK
ncbi:MAG: hypothetical protein PHE43_01025 [Candidatus Nanoarchaeia archaeon]|nr:hypothetical protein [Candidatus Nanoarchaeia archaeon]